MKLTYFIAGNGLVKIGSSRDPKTRLSQLAVACPYPLELLKVCAISERDAHRIAGDLTTRGAGEWFHDTPALREWMNTLPDSFAAPVKRPVPAPQPSPRQSSAVMVHVDLGHLLTAEEIEKFKAAAQAANAPNLTEHFLDLTLRHQVAA